eukprot:821887-Amphidinium_carterae.2
MSGGHTAGKMTIPVAVESGLVVCQAQSRRVRLTASSRDMVRWRISMPYPCSGNKTKTKGKGDGKGDGRKGGGKGRDRSRLRVELQYKVLHNMDVRLTGLLREIGREATAEFYICCALTCHRAEHCVKLENLPNDMEREELSRKPGLSAKGCSALNKTLFLPDEVSCVVRVEQSNLSTPEDQWRCD